MKARASTLLPVRCWRPMFVTLLWVFTVLGLSNQAAFAQNISLDHPVKCGKLQCFPSADDESKYFYLAANPHVATNDAGKHEFSFTRYVQAASDVNGEGGIVDADGGGIVHFLVDYSVTDEQLGNARAAITKINKEATIAGPIVFESGNFALVTSFVPDEDKPNDLAKTMLGVGAAPLIEGLKAAVSIHLTKKGSQILWNSFQMDTPDISLVFEMTFSGLNDPAEAVITADWEKLQNQADVSMGADISYLGIGGGFDYSNFWQQASNTGAVTIEYKGDPDKLQGIVERTHAKLHDLMFEPIRVEPSSADGSDDPLATMLAVANASQQAGGSSYSAPWEVKINGGYKRRKLTHKGKYQFNFKQRTKSSLTTAMAGNIGSLYRLYGNDESVFRTINLSVEEFRVREISVALDARDEQVFTKYINSATVFVKKTHGSGKQSMGEVLIKRSNFVSGKPQKVAYNWDKEASIEDWMQYSYKADWSFVGGAKYSSGWVSSNEAAITLTPPYQYREIEFLSSPDILKEENVRMVSIRVNHNFFGRAVTENINLLPSRGEFNATRVFAIPPDDQSLEYSVTWTLNDRRRITSGLKQSDETVIFCDELPK